MGDAVAPKHWFWRPPPAAGGPSRRAESVEERREATALRLPRWRRRSPGWQCASIHCDIMAQRRDEGVLAVASTAADGHARRARSVEGRWGSFVVRPCPCYVLRVRESG
eukprot:7212763-Prymnesium_polylepis.1